MKKEIAHLAKSYLQEIYTENKADTCCRRKAIIDDFFGLNKESVMTSMACIGQKLGISREAVRQSIEDFSEFVSTHARSSDLAEAARYADRHEALFCLGADNKIKTCQAMFLFRVIKYLLRNDHIKERRINRRLYLAYFHEIDIKRIQSLCVKQISHNGAVMLNEICDENFPAGATPHNRELLKAILSLRGSDLSAVSTHLGEYVFFRKTGRNRLVSRLKKIFHFYAAVETENLRAALMRDMLRRDSAISVLPPNEVILTIAGQTLGAKIEQGVVLVESMPCKDSKNNQYEDSIVDFIHGSAVNNHGATRREREIERAVKKSAKDAYGFSMAINHSPLVVRVRRGVYQLTGEMRVA